MGNSVVIVGASRGLGLEFARQYAAEGWQVVGTVRREADAGALKSLPKSDAFVLDIRDQGGFAEFADALRARGIVPSVVIHNAGVNVGANSGFAETNFADWEQTLAANVTGAVGTARYLVPLLPEKKDAKAVFLTSELGSIERNNGGFLPYRASKAALNMLVKSLAVEQARRGVVCLALHPGWVKTDMGGPNAPLEAPEAVALMRATIAKAAMTGTGAFVDNKGARLPY